jgi:hypothetical protein
MYYTEVPSLAPLHFFRLNVDVKRDKATRLPDTSELLHEEKFADVSMTWNDSGITVHVDVHKKFEEAAYPKFEEGDAIELFFDTRDLKEAGFPTRFCHHFLILPQEVQGVQALEMTRFRNEDSHPLCNPETIQVKAKIEPRRYTVDIHCPAEILHGYDPKGFDRLGFTYCIHRPKNGSQHFAVSSSYVPVAQHPSLWATCKLT